MKRITTLIAIGAATLGFAACGSGTHSSQARGQLISQCMAGDASQHAGCVCLVNAAVAQGFSFATLEQQMNLGLAADKRLLADGFVCGAVQIRVGN